MLLGLSKWSSTSESRRSGNSAASSWDYGTPLYRWLTANPAFAKQADTTPAKLYAAFTRAGGIEWEADARPEPQALIDEEIARENEFELNIAELNEEIEDAENAFSNKPPNLRRRGRY